MGGVFFKENLYQHLDSGDCILGLWKEIMQQMFFAAKD